MTRELIERMRLLELDHQPDGWPEVQMRDISALCDAVQECGAGAGCCHQAAEIERLTQQLQTQRAGVRAVIAAAVALVCAPAWAGVSDEDVALEQALRDAGFVKPNDRHNRAPRSGDPG